MLNKIFNKKLILASIILGSFFSHANASQVTEIHDVSKVEEYSADKPSMSIGIAAEGDYTFGTYDPIEQQFDFKVPNVGAAGDKSTTSFKSSSQKLKHTITVDNEFKAGIEAKYYGDMLNVIVSPLFSVKGGDITLTGTDIDKLGAFDVEGFSLSPVGTPGVFAKDSKGNVKFKVVNTKLVQTPRPITLKIGAGLDLINTDMIRFGLGLAAETQFGAAKLTSTGEATSVEETGANKAKISLSGEEKEDTTKNNWYSGKIDPSLRASLALNLGEDTGFTLGVSGFVKYVSKEKREITMKNEYNYEETLAADRPAGVTADDRFVKEAKKDASYKNKETTESAFTYETPAIYKLGGSIHIGVTF